MPILRIEISGSGPDNDAPTVDDLIGQLGDFLDLLREVESVVGAAGEREELVWRVVGARRSSPLMVEIAAFPKTHGMNIARRESEVVRGAAEGLRALRTGAARPLLFNDKALRKAGEIFGRVTNGLSETKIAFPDSLPSLDLTREGARVAAANVSRVQTPDDKPYRELGSVEGYFNAVERDGFGRPLLWLRTRVSADRVKCIMRGSALLEMQRREIGDMLADGRRLQVSGLLHFKGLGRLSQVDADRLEVIRAENLPQLDDIVDPDFTGGLRSERYLEGVRNGKPA